MKLKNHYYSALAVLLPLLGFSSCGKSSNDDILLEYGCPTSSYKFFGTVKSTDGTPIKGIKAITVGNGGDKPYHIDSTLTDEQGRYVINASRFDGNMKLIKDKVVYVAFEDIDGAENGGSFKKDTLIGDQLKVTTVKDGDGHWYKGGYEVEGDITLKKE